MVQSQYTNTIQYVYPILQAHWHVHFERVVSFPEVQSLVEAGRRKCRLLEPFECAVRAFKVPCSSNDNTGRCRESDPSIRNRRF